ncbi:MAG: tRNA 2-thiouridine(34) synthase MnmA [Actinomycetota bacterium]|nr:tRNA 2-thiouridine(34) synthase MnmA [Actinomycetota bacterium]
MKVLVAMSGGVDSAVAAALLRDEGHDVTGVHLKLADVPLDEQVPGQGCCTLDDAQDARRVAQVLDIPFYVWDLTEVFAREVEQPFAATYARGWTPNPCIACNRKVKYAALLARARALGFDALATGHHVRRRRGDDAGWRLMRAVDRAKDQTYVLYVATQEQLAHSLFPAGELTKEEVRGEAQRRGLRVARKPDSYDVCFVPGGDAGSYLGARLPAVPGPIIDLGGRVLGTHDGIWRYTVGQRRRLGLGSHERRYVVALDHQRNSVLVGPRAALGCSWIDLAEVSWVSGPAPLVPVTAQIRAHAESVPASLSRQGSRWRVSFEPPIQGVAEGQACVFYSAQDGEECLGGGTIVGAERPAAACERRSGGATREEPSQVS